ncbi:unnamed protein product [Paramecium pentaurelia]|uniref:Uncharacterized protein n=1 Tax=Paramecium pentaurelia TaxID=43138 RepID=A0A8S1VR86_9CILI|nr:unnamed protein product [Paramecium pentaurelia]
MKWKIYIISITLLLLNTQLDAYQLCFKRQARIRSILRGNYQNALNQNRGALISSKLQNGFAGGVQGSSLRDNIYTITGGFGYTASAIGNSIIFDLQQQYELNTLKVWLWDQDDRVYRLKVYLIQNDVETQIFESNFVQKILTIKFPDQQVQKFKIYNVNGNTYNVGLHIIKIEGLYKLQTNM